jgi:hypothetical protein
VTSAEAVLCRLEVDARGAPPRRIRVEARACPPGFSVWCFDSEQCPDGVQIGKSDQRYEARRFAEIVRDYKIQFRIRYIDGESWRASIEWSDVEVTGERGFRAHLLRRAVCEWPCKIALQESDAGYGAIDAAFGESSDGDEAWGLLIDIVVYGRGQLTELLSRHGLPATSSAIRALADKLKSDHDRPYLEQDARRQTAIAPFRREIEAVAAKFNNEPIRGAGSVWPSSRAFMTMFLEQYVVKHARMPQGKVEGKYEFAGGPQNMGTLDFDEIGRRPPWPDAAQSSRENAS